MTNLDYYIKEIKENKNKPRIFLDGLQAARAGFAPGDKYEIQIDGHRLTLIAHKDGSRTVTGRVNKRTGEKSIPVIDLNSNAVLGLFEGMTSVRMIVRQGAIVFLPLASELAKKERLDRLAYKVANSEPLKIGDLTHGMGILSNALHKGLIKAGVNADLAFVNEIREELLIHSREHNDVWNDGTMGIAAPMQELIQDQWLMDHLPLVEFLSMSLPCSGASKAGASKLKLAKMEDHEHVGHLVYAALVIISKVKPAALLLENVEQYAATASASILRKQLTDMGYNIHEAVLNGKDFGCLESRVRWALVATTEGLSFSFDQIIPEVTVISKVGDILDDIPLDDLRWTKNEGLKAKEVRDIEAGKGFRLPLVTEESTSVPTLRKHYQKKGSCDVQILHPVDKEYARLFTGDEHLRLKGIDQKLFGDVSDAMKHQGAGQAVQPPVFEPIGERLGKSMLAAKPYTRKSKKESIELFAQTVQENLPYEPILNVAAITMNAIAVLQLEASKNDSDDDSEPTPRRKSRKMGGGGIG